MDIQWFPGHMAKAKRKIEENLKLVDVVIELVDARIPLSSANPLLEKMIGKRKPKLLILNKEDLADSKRTELWINKLENSGTKVIAINSNDSQKKVKQAVLTAIEVLTASKREKFVKKGASNIEIRAMIVGIPNVGKSTFINKIIGKKLAVTGNKPGVTKGNQWIRLSNEVELLDTPGLLWHKFDDPQVGEKLAMTGAINDTIFVWEDIAYKLLKYIQREYPLALKNRYELEDISDFRDVDTYELMQLIGRKRGALSKGNNVDDLKTAHIIIKDFREGKLGRITLE